MNFSLLTRALAAIIGLLVMAGVAWAVPGFWAETQRVCADSDETVVLLHGLGRSSRSMTAQRDFLVEAGYNVINVDYHSTDDGIPEIARQVAEQIAAPACDKPPATLHFVTHSMGGILVRQMLADGLLDGLPSTPGRAVMISPPNQGSEVVDKLGGWALFKWMNGPAGQQLGTDAQAVPVRLGAAPMTVGVITGDRSINFLLSMLIPGPDDGKVAVERAKLEGMTDFLVLHRTHPFIMSSSDTLEETLHFIEHGQFAHKPEKPKE